MSLKIAHLNDCYILGKINKYICDLRPGYYFVTLGASRWYLILFSFPSMVLVIVFYSFLSSLDQWHHVTTRSLCFFICLNRD